MSVDPEHLAEMVKGYLEVTVELAGALANLRLAVAHDLGPIKERMVEAALAEADDALARFQMVDPAGFAAVVGNEQDHVDEIRRQQGLDPEFG